MLTLERALILSACLTFTGFIILSMQAAGERTGLDRGQSSLATRQAASG